MFLQIIIYILFESFYTFFNLNSHKNGWNKILDEENGRLQISYKRNQKQRTFSNKCR